MAYVVDRVLICDAFREPDRHYRLLPGGRSKRVETSRPSMRFLASAKDVKGGIAGVVGKEAQLFDELSAAAAEQNEFVNQLRDDVRAWREAGYPGTAAVTRRLLESWFERDEERRAVGRRFFWVFVKSCGYVRPFLQLRQHSGEHLQAQVFLVA